MKFKLAALLTLMLAFSAGQVVQLCKHESGPVHWFAGNFCDGTLSHGQGSKGHAEHKSASHSHDHGHDHSGEHSQHASSGEHHEPCTHETISTGDDLVSQLTSPHFSHVLIVHFLPFEELSVEQWHPQITDKQRLYVTRGPPGNGGPQDHFHATIRLLI